MDDKLLISELYNRFPIFYEINDPILENDPYCVCGDFGLFLNDLISLYKEGIIIEKSYYTNSEIGEFYNKKTLKDEIKKIFIFLDEIFLNGNSRNIDILNTCIFEALIGNDYSYNLFRNNSSKITYNHFLEVCKRVQ